MKKTVMVLCLLILINIPITLANSAQSGVLIDSSSGRILQENNASEKLGPASCTKIMTAIVALENSKLTDIVTTSMKAAYTEGTSIYLKIGEKRTMEELLYALMLESGNDAATAIAEHISSTTEKFAELMTKTAIEKIGVKDTRFTNPHGLSNEQHYTTAHDLALITRYALRIPTFAEIVSTKIKSIPMEGESWNRRLTNSNKMLNIYEGADGVKTGFTKATGRTLVSSATRDGMQLIAVTLNDPDDWDDHAQMLDYGFENYKSVCLLVKDTNLSQLVGDAVPGVPHNSKVVLSEDLLVALKEGEEAIFEYEIFEKLPRKLKNGDQIGAAYAKLNSETIATIPLIVKIEYTKADQFWDTYFKLWKGI
ncbi:MAG: D-alanyl-D-alanine carboxypeptidase [Oscillospiraceae bacterium]|nr:D-alanyl-D-alanine carboxypeptidase [Oscillospiraceae bacterium]